VNGEVKKKIPVSSSLDSRPVSDQLSLIPYHTIPYHTLPYRIIPSPIVLYSPVGTLCKLHVGGWRSLCCGTCGFCGRMAASEHSFVVQFFLGFRGCQVPCE
jgi:hypothetical protein